MAGGPNAAPEDPSSSSPPDKAQAAAGLATAQRPEISLATATASVRKIEPALLKELVEHSTALALGRGGVKPVTYLVYLVEEAPLGDLANVPSMTARRGQLVDRLQTIARQSQVNVIEVLKRQRQAGRVAGYRSYWVFNGLAVDGDLSTALQLAELPQVLAIRRNRVHHLTDPARSTVLDAGQEEGNIAATGAPHVWSELGITGRDIVVANMDSGVDWLHPALLPQYRGYQGDVMSAEHDYNWFDATGTYRDAPGPNRGNISRWSDHGTHTMGTIVGREADGRNAIGMAPGARWIALKVFDDQGDSTDEWIHAGFQWCLAPTDLAGHNADPSRAPHIVSNSWGDDNGLDDTFRRDLAAWRAAGIFSVWASGNAGPAVGTVGSPASLDIAFAVGAIDAAEGIASFSSRGPSPWGGIVKPEVVAPGVNIRSAIAGGTYESGWNGTSMATPHVAGLAALMWDAANQDLGITRTEQILTSTARDLGVAGPDNDYGHGRIDAYQAVSTVFQGGAFTGRVVEASTEQPLDGARIRLVSRHTGGETLAMTNASGYYTVTVASGSYDVTATKFGYEPSRVEDLQIAAGYSTQLRFELRRLPGGILRGRVTLQGTQLVEPAVVSLVGTDQSATIDAQGYYTFHVPIGTYVVRALPACAGYKGAQSPGLYVSEGSTVSGDLALAPMPLILLVEADTWTPSGAVAGYYRTSFDELLYGYDEWSIADPPADTPTKTDLAGYDVIVWAQAVSSPGYVGAWDDLGELLQSGGRLLISGQDIGYWDNQSGAIEDYEGYLHASYLADDAGEHAPVPVSGGLFDGISLLLNTADSASNQTEPDLIAPLDSLAQAVLTTPTGGGLGLQVEPCNGRVLYLSFGVEGIGPEAARREVLRRSIEWLSAELPAKAARLTIETASLASAPGSRTSYRLGAVNRGTWTAAFDVDITSAVWQAQLLDAYTLEPIGERLVLPPCEERALILDVMVPNTAVINTAADTVVSLSPATGPGEGDSVTATTVAMPLWEQESDMPTPRYRLAGVADGCRFYAIGGFDLEGNAVDTVEVLDLATRQWNTVASRLTAAANSAAVMLDGRLYLIGGYDPNGNGDERLATVEFYDPVSDTWATATALPEATSGMTAIALDGRIYAMGGNTVDGEFTASYIYDPGADSWSSGPSLPMEDTSFARALVLDGSIYLVGGWPGQKGIYRYDPDKGQWEALAPMHTERHSFGLITDGQYIYAAGGGSEWQGTGAAERYDPARDMWTILPALRFGERAGAVAGYADGQFLLVGGTTGASGKSLETLGIRSPGASSSLAVARDFARPGDTLTYNMRVGNPGLQTVWTHWSLPLPQSLVFVAGSASPGVSYDTGSATLSWARNLGPSAEQVLEFAARIADDAATGSTITATATLQAGGCAQHELVATTLVAVPSLAASTKSADKTQVLPGSILHYTVIVANDTPFTIPNASLVDPIPQHTTLVTSSLQGGSYNTNLNRIEWNGALAAGRLGDASFDWIDATRGFNLELGDDECSSALDLGFDFEFYGQIYSQIFVSSNGLVQLGGCSTRYTNDAIPNDNAPNGYLAPFWDDLAPIPSGGNVHYLVAGSAPNRCAVVEWHEVPAYGQGAPLTFQVLIFEGANRVVFQYLEVSGERGTGAEATVGIESPDGTKGVQYLYDGQPQDHLLHDRLAIELLHSSTRQATTHTLLYDVRVAEEVPPLVEIVNNAWIDDGEQVHQRQAVATVRAPDLSPSVKFCDLIEALGGQVLRYTLHIGNASEITATQLQVADSLPQELTFVPGSLQGGATYSEATRQITWQGELAGHEQFDITYQASIANSLGINHPVTNTATISERGVVLRTLEEGILANTVDLRGSTVVADRSQVAAGESLSYVVTVKNDGLYRADQVTLVDSLPAELTMVPGTLLGGVYEGDLRRITWLGPLDPGESHAVSFTALVSDTARHDQQITNEVLLSDGHGGTVQKSVTVRVLRGDLSQSQMVAQPGRVSPCGTVTFTVQIANSGEFPVGATLRNEPPETITVHPSSLYASDGEVSWDGGAVTWQGQVARNGMVIVRYSALVSHDVEGLYITNEALITDEGGLSYPLVARAVISGNDVTQFPLVFQGYRAYPR